jgi:hypothetical protein
LHRRLAELIGRDSFNSELGGAEDAPVPVTRKPGPKGLRGGAAVPLPGEDLPM